MEKNLSVGETPAEFLDDSTVWKDVMKISSAAFSDGDKMPVRYTGDGEDISPPLAWSDPPKGCREYALTVLDPDAPGGKAHPFVHWLAYGIPAEVTSLPDGIPMWGEIGAPVTFNQGVNSFGRVGYNGPLPPKGDSPHHYIFKLYALDTKLNLAAEEDKDRILKAMDKHILASDEMIVQYQR
jgi:Raf kinase inhibitor-like YbhB/YbcL family protein